MSYSLGRWDDEKGYDADLEEDHQEDDVAVDSDDREEIRCPRCHGTGIEYVQDQETDCLNCEGYGTILVGSDNRHTIPSGFTD